MISTIMHTATDSELHHGGAGLDRGLRHALHADDPVFREGRSRRPHEIRRPRARRNPGARAGPPEFRAGPRGEGQPAQPAQHIGPRHRRAAEPAHRACRCRHGGQAALGRVSLAERPEHVPVRAVPPAVRLPGRRARLPSRSPRACHQAVHHPPAGLRRRRLCRFLRADPLCQQPRGQAAEVDPCRLARCPRPDADLRGIGRVDRGRAAPGGRRDRPAVRSAGGGTGADDGGALLSARTGGSRWRTSARAPGSMRSSR